MGGGGVAVGEGVAVDVGQTLGRRWVDVGQTLGIRSSHPGVIFMDFEWFFREQERSMVLSINNGRFYNKETASWGFVSDWSPLRAF